MARESTSPSFPRMPQLWNSAYSTDPTPTHTRRAFEWRSKPIRSGTCTCRRYGPDSIMATASMGLMSRKPDTALIRTTS